nr:hypothetical protein [Shewanella marina]
MRKIAKRIGLVDQPNARKLHHGAIPLVGGISIFSTLVVTFLIFMPMSNNLTIYLGCSAVLIIVGVLDDYYDVSFKVRLFVQAGISLAMMLLGKHSLHNLGF